jgi:hypothetical protein
MFSEGGVGLEQQGNELFNGGEIEGQQGRLMPYVAWKRCPLEGVKV